LGSMETFIVVIALMASAAGTLLLLACLANKRSQLVQAYNVSMEADSRGQNSENNINKHDENVSAKTVPEVS